MEFKDLIEFINIASSENFKDSTKKAIDFIDKIPLKSFKELVKNIGTIPECIEHDSTQEKLYSKVSDIVLARCFRELGLKSKALNSRADSADIIAESVCGYSYSLVADAKCFRLSRTAKNQKDFKISNLSNWRGSENEYAVLVSPYYQYPKKSSQIYSMALEKNVCLLSWEHISILLDNNIKESENFSLESIWNISQMIARDKTLSFANAKQCLLPKIDSYIAKKINKNAAEFKEILQKYKILIKKRGQDEISYWQNCIKEIERYSKERAILELIKAKKLQEKITMISTYINGLKNE